jgi:ABC-2 type transport system ATP-binding protein
MIPTLELRSVSKAYGDFVAVDRISMSIRSGTIFGLLGPNGAGKTTTIRMIMDIIAPDQGEVLFQGNPRSAKDLSNIGYLPEERGLYRKMTITDHLLFLAELHGMSRSQALPAIEIWLEKVQLSAWAKKRVEELSKGMQQKIQLVGTVLHEPDLLILDEPFSGLDPVNQILFKDLLDEYRSLGKTVIFSTHIMDQADKLCDHICLISHGKPVLNGELSEIKRSFGGNSYRLIAEGDLAPVAALAGVDQVIPLDGGAMLLLDAGIPGAEVLTDLVGLMTVREFRSEEPSLEDIFIKAVRDAGS